MDIVYILKDSSYNDYIELRYSLRSLVNIEHNNVYIVSRNLPDWVKNVKHIKCCDIYGTNQLNALNKIATACKENISEEFILMNDDFYILKPTEVPYLCNGTLKELINYRNVKSDYTDCLKRTDKLFKNTINFEIHFPIIYNKQKFLDLYNHYRLDNGYVLRSLYCNHYGIKGVENKDNKIYSRSSFENKDVPFMSSSDGYVNTTRFNKTMDSILPTKSEYEV